MRDVSLGVLGLINDAANDRGCSGLRSHKTGS